jgi:hypothetical protein
MVAVVENGLDIEDTLYEASAAGPITVLDVIYGWGKEIMESGNDFYAHKTGFTQQSLTRTLHHNGFLHVFPGIGQFEIGAIATTAPH